MINKQILKVISINKITLSKYSLLKPFHSMELLKNNLKSNFIVNSNRKFFFGSKKKEDESKEETEKEATKESAKEHKESKEETVPLTKYNHLKELYEDSESNLQKARTKFDDLRKAFIENQSDLERIRKRSEIEVGNAKEFAITKFAKDLLDVHDNFDRALYFVKDINIDESSISDENLSESIKKYKDFCEGITMTKDSLIKILGVHGIKQYNPVNEKFDPTKHEAVFQSVSETLSPGTISDVVQTGFMIGNRILRPAKVGVVKKN